MRSCKNNNNNQEKASNSNWILILTFMHGKRNQLYMRDGVLLFVLAVRSVAELDDVEPVVKKTGSQNYHDFVVCM